DIGDDGFGICHDQTSVWDVTHAIGRARGLYEDKKRTKEINLLSLVERQGPCIAPLLLLCRRGPGRIYGNGSYPLPPHGWHRAMRPSRLPVASLTRMRRVTVYGHLSLPAAMVH
ncbi:MAG: hypothetical protein EOP84_19255, partial [Verrucomicrobiaceae bacterium]